MCEASFNLGMLHMQGEGVGRDLWRARELLRRAERQNPKNEAPAVFLADLDTMIAAEEKEKEKGGRKENK